MPIPETQPLKWSPRGCSDAADSRAAFPGAMQLLSNLVPDPSTMDAWVPRPASISLTTFGSFTTPGFQSGQLIVGDILYGMIASGRNANKDEPYAYNLATNTFLTVNGITNANTPTSPATSGDWTPPFLAQVGSVIVVTHPGFPGGATKFGWFDISGFSSSSVTGSTHNGTAVIDTLSTNPIAAGFQPGMTISDASGDIPASTTILSLTTTTITISQNMTGSHAGDALTVNGGTATTPLWGAGDTNIQNLPSVPVGVAQMNGRAYFVCGTNGIPFSDPLAARNRTNASQALTTNDGLASTAIGALGASQTAGGSPIVSALIVFESVYKMQIITGDPATNNLQMNTLPLATGTFAPLTVTNGKMGLTFVSPEGLRYVDLLGNVSQPVGDHGTGVTVPFINAVNPSRMQSASNADSIVFTVNNAKAPGGNAFQEWVYDVTRQVWHGPHTFPFDLLDVWKNTFVGSAHGVTHTLWQHDVVPTTSSTYTENGTALTWEYETSLLPDSPEMEMTAIVESTIMIAVGATNATIVPMDESGNALDTIIMSGSDSPTQWDNFSWDNANWDGSPGTYKERRLNWHVPIIWKQGTIQVNAASQSIQRIGPVSMRYRKLGYLIPSAA